MTNKYYLIVITILAVCLCSCVNQGSSDANSNNECRVFTETFTEIGFSITTPCKLEDVSSKSSGDFVINYGGVENPNNDNDMAAYQVIVTKLPIGYKDLSKVDLDQFIESQLGQSFKNFTNVKNIRFSEEEYIGIVGYTTHNGLQQKGVMFCKDGYIIALTLMTNSKLEERFNKFTNGFKVLSNESESIQQNKLKVAPKPISPTLPKQYNHTNFSFNYPKTWEIVQQNRKATQHTTIAVQIMDQSVSSNDFTSNINVIVSSDKHSESTNELAKISFNQIKQSGISCSLNEIRNVTIGGYNGSVADYIVRLQGYSLRYYQYIVKKTDNTTITITITLDNNKLSKYNKIAKEMINSFTIK